MEAKELREYLKYVLDLECAIYQTNQLKNEYQTKRTAAKPKENTLCLPNKPEDPRVRSEYITFSEAQKKLSSGSLIMWTLSLIVAGFCVPFPILMGIAMGAWTSIQTNMLIIGLIAAIPMAYLIYQTKQIQQDEEYNIAKQNQKERERYQAEMKAYTEKCQSIQERNQASHRIHTQALTTYNKETQETLDKLAETETSLKTSLYTLYSKNVVYAKYRNLVTIATLFEYIDSGRCFELEGPNGAYNLYEGELRSDIIISSLSSIISNLEAIRNNQYTLYQSIENAHATTRDLLLNINNTQMLTAYYAKQAAMAASADRYIVGMVW